MKFLCCDVMGGGRGFKTVTSRRGCILSVSCLDAKRGSVTFLTIVWKCPFSAVLFSITTQQQYVPDQAYRS